MRFAAGYRRPSTVMQRYRYKCRVMFSPPLPHPPKNDIHARVDYTCKTTLYYYRYRYSRYYYYYYHKGIANHRSL